MYFKQKLDCSRRYHLESYAVTNNALIVCEVMCPNTKLFVVCADTPPGANNAFCDIIRTYHSNGLIQYLQVSPVRNLELGGFLT